MKLLEIVAILLLLTIVLYGLFWPKTQTVYKDKNGSFVLVVYISGTVVILQYVEYNKDSNKWSAVTGPQNWNIWEFIKTFRLWKLL